MDVFEFIELYKHDLYYIFKKWERLSNYFTDDPNYLLNWLKSQNFWDHTTLAKDIQYLNDNIDKYYNNPEYYDYVDDYVSDYYNLYNKFCSLGYEQHIELLPKEISDIIKKYNIKNILLNVYDKNTRQDTEMYEKHVLNNPNYLKNGEYDIITHILYEIEHNFNWIHCVDPPSKIKLLNTPIYEYGEEISYRLYDRKFINEIKLFIDIKKTIDIYNNAVLEFKEFHPRSIYLHEIVARFT
jgi:hypothetical protein